MRGFLLGLSYGTTCLAFCAPVLVPFFLQQGRGVRANLGTLAQFLGGRLAGYLALGLLAWATGSLLARATAYDRLVVGGAYVGLALLLLVAVLRPAPEGVGCPLPAARGWLARWPALIPAGMGLLAGLKLCPPVLLAFADASGAGSLAGSLLFFLAFFVGTSLYFLPVALVGAVARQPALRIIGRFAAVLVALYYLFAGGMLLVGGVT